MASLADAIRGVYRDVLQGANNQIIHDSGWVSNTIVDRCRILLAGFMKSESASGIQSLFVGAGDDSWDTTGPPAPSVTETELVTPYEEPMPMEGLDVVYLDAQDEVSDDPTSRLQITATLPPGYPTLTSYPLREFGLFGDYNGTPYMINNIRHPVIHKDASATLIRVVRLYF